MRAITHIAACVAFKLSALMNSIFFLFDEGKRQRDGALRKSGVEKLQSWKEAGPGSH